MRKGWYLPLVLVLATVLLAACGGGGGSAQGGGAGAGAGAGATAPASGGAAGGAAGGASAGSGNVGNGETIFKQATVGANPGCATCHSLDGSQLVGPTMQGIGTRAATRVQGQSAEEYLRAAIVDPNAHVVEGFVQGVMPTYRDVLQEAELNDLVAYLASLK